MSITCLLFNVQRTAAALFATLRPECQQCRLLYLLPALRLPYAAAVAQNAPATAVAQGAAIANAGQTAITQCDVYAKDTELYKACVNTPPVRRRRTGLLPRRACRAPPPGPILRHYRRLTLLPKQLIGLPTYLPASQHAACTADDERCSRMCGDAQQALYHTRDEEWGRLGRI